MTKSDVSGGSSSIDDLLDFRVIGTRIHTGHFQSSLDKLVPAQGYQGYQGYQSYQGYRGYQGYQYHSPDTTLQYTAVQAIRITRVIRGDHTATQEHRKPGAIMHTVQCSIWYIPLCVCKRAKSK